MRVRVVGHARQALTGWELAEGTPDGWLPAEVPGTAASSLRALGRPHRRYDASDWYFRCRFPAVPGARVLRFGGLATLAEVTLNGAPILSSENMFLEHEVAVQLGADNALVIHFRALDAALQARRPRPRWKTRLVANQQLRWFRTTLLGRIPGWSPPVAPVGPWREVELCERASPWVDVRAEDGVVAVRARIEAEDGELVAGGARARLRAEDGWLVGAVAIPGAQRWWPHSHGAQPRYPVAIHAGGEVVDCGQVGFRTVAAGPSDGDFSVRVNGERIFCRGACWTTPDIATLRAAPDALRAELELMRRAGMNMVRVGGTMVYEDDAFYDLCDELGILVWQDFMFANLDYPTDAGFVAGVRREARELCQRLQGRPSLTVLCGNSEIEQQVAMLGLPRAAWSGPLFQEVLPQVARELVPEVPYVPSSPCGGPLPFHPDVGVAHYYGVGAYLRPLEDARRAGVRFTSECLAFANVPEPATVEAVLGDGEAPSHHPRWKERVPRDTGPGWDFEDVRDHYVARLFGVDPARVRYADAERYLELGRVTTGAVMAATLAEWRHAGSTCAGALIWFWKDLWPGAGWGIVDSFGRPKAAYFMAKPVLAPVALLLTDEGLAGPRLHAVNDGPEPVDAELAVRLWCDGSVQVAAGARALTIPARGQVAVAADALLERFLDLSYAYRFGPPGHDAVVATLHVGGALAGEAFFWPRGLPAEREPDLGLTARATAEPGGFAMELGAARLAVAVALDVTGGVPDENYFHLEPGRPRAVRVRGPGPLRGTVKALNGQAQARISV